MRLIEAGLEIYGGMAPQKELTFEHWVRVHLSIMHGGSTGLLSLVKAANIMARTGAGQTGKSAVTPMLSMSRDAFLSNCPSRGTVSSRLFPWNLVVYSLCF